MCLESFFKLQRFELSQQLCTSGFQSITLEEEKGTRLAETRDGISSVGDYKCRLLPSSSRTLILALF